MNAPYSASVGNVANVQRLILYEGAMVDPVDAAAASQQSAGPCEHASNWAMSARRADAEIVCGSDGSNAVGSTMRFATMQR